MSLLLTASSPNVTVALVGQAFSFQQGSIVASLSVPTVGQAGSFSQGSLTPSISVGATGQIMTFGLGALSPANSISLSGQVLVFSQGSLVSAIDTNLAGNQMTFSVGSLDPAISSSHISSGSSGGGVYWQLPRKRKRLKDDPNRHLDSILEKSVAEYYADLVKPGIQKSIQQEARHIVKPFREESKKIDWSALENNAQAISRLIALWHRENMEREDEEFIILDS